MSGTFEISRETRPLNPSLIVKGSTNVRKHQKRDGGDDDEESRKGSTKGRDRTGIYRRCNFVKDPGERISISISGLTTSVEEIDSRSVETTG